MSNLIYAPLLGTKMINIYEQRLLERLTNAVGAVLVICLPPKDECIDRWKKRKEDELVQDIDTIATIWEKYSSFQIMGLPTVSLNPFATDPSTIMRELDQMRGRHVSD